MTRALNPVPKLMLLAGLLVLAYLANRYGILQKTLVWMKGMGPFAPLLFVAVYALTCVFFVPSFFFTFGAGSLFGIALGIPLALLGTGLGSAAALIIGRYGARNFVAKRFENNSKFKALETALGKKGWQIVVLARLSPVFPFSVGNYAFGLTPISVRAYFFASMLGTIPSAAVYVYLGKITGSLAGPGRTHSPAEWGLLILGLIATVALTLVIQRTAKKALAERVPGT